jgi:5,5'-dehydrodivanillate O-demethylase
VSLELGIPEEHGLRCPYHGWLFDTDGTCLDQPCEPADSTYKERMRSTTYPVEELGGLIFAYLGPKPAPLLPRYEFLVWENVVRHIGVTVLPCNWLQCMENSVDPMHVEWLHGRYMDYLWRRQGKVRSMTWRRPLKIGFDRFNLGITKRRVLEGQSEESAMWTEGQNPLFFPTMGRAESAFQYRVPIDDTHTLNYQYSVYRTGASLPRQASIPKYDIKLTDEYGKLMTGILLVQDFAAWVSQGEIAERDKEHLGQSDVGVIMLRELLEEQIDLVSRGEDPIGVFREAPPGGVIPIPSNGSRAELPGSSRFAQEWFEETLSPLRDQLLELQAELERGVAAGDFSTPPTGTTFVPIGEHHKQVVLLPSERELVSTGD